MSGRGRMVSLHRKAPLSSARQSSSCISSLCTLQLLTWKGEYVQLCMYTGLGFWVLGAVGTIYSYTTGGMSLTRPTLGENETPS